MTKKPKEVTAKSAIKAFHKAGKDLQIEKLKKMIEAEREKVKGYEEIAKVHSAYIAILLKKLGATDSNNAITIPKGEVVEALEHYEARATIDTIDNSWKLYCEVIE